MRIIRVCTLVLTVILVCTSQPVPAQSPGSLASLMPFSWNPENWAGNVPSVRPSVRVGYARMGLNLNFPMPLIPGTGIRTVDLQVLDANLWTGTVLFDVQVMSRVKLFLSGQGNAQRNVTALTFPEPTFTNLPIDWTGSKLEWWAVEGGVVYTLLNDINLLVGLRRDHWSIGLTDPRFLGIAIVPTVWSFYSGDIQTKMWIPYFGLEFTGTNYQVRLLGSPFPWAEVKFPLRVGFNPADFNDLKYALKKSGAFLEVDFAYRVQPFSDIGFGVWGNLSWLRARGRGTEDFIERGIVNLGPFSSSAVSTLTRYSAGGGLSAELTF